MDEQSFRVTPTEQRALQAIRRGLSPSEQDKSALLLAVMAKCSAVALSADTTPTDLPSSSEHSPTTHSAAAATDPNALAASIDGELQPVAAGSSQAEGALAGGHPALGTAAVGSTTTGGTTVGSSLAGTPAVSASGVAILKTALLAATVSGALAFWSGYTVGRSDAGGSAPPPSFANAGEHEGPGRTPPLRPEQRAPAGTPRETAPEPKMKPQEATSPSPRSSPATDQPAPARKATSPSTRVGEEVEPTFYDELQHVQRAQSALSAGRPALALGLMESLDERSPRGALLTERRMTKVLALCALERTEEATGMAREVLARTSGDAYRTRLASSCARGAVDSHFGDEKTGD